MTICLLTFFYAASCFIPSAHVTPSDGTSGDRFGSAVAIGGSHLLSGAPLQGSSGYHAGVVYAFEASDTEWVEVQHIRPDDLAAYGEFGTAIAIEGDFAAIGWKAASTVANGAGMVVLYEWSDGLWQELDRIWDPEAEAGDRFGTSIDIDGDWMIIGCQLDDVNGTDSGSALVFNRSKDGWVFEQRLEPSGGGPFHWAGHAVAIDGSRAVVGAYLESVDGHQAAGAAYLYHRDEAGHWSEETRLVADDPVSGDYFGYSVSLEGDRLAVGSILNDAPLEDSGEVYLFEHVEGAWVLEHLPPPDDGGEFGYALALDGADLFVGAVYHPGNGIANGAVYHFEHDGDQWAWSTTWLPMDGADNCFFGASLSTNGLSLAIGAPHENITGLGSGAVYVHDLDAPCLGDLNGDQAIDVTDLLAVIGSWGDPYNVDDLLLVIGGWGPCP